VRRLASDVVTQAKADPSYTGALKLQPVAESAAGEGGCQ
jgi:hypothetical protein